MLASSLSPEPPSGFQSPELVLRLLDASGAQVYLLDLEAGHVVDCSDGACRALGYTREEIRDLPLGLIDANLANGADFSEMREQLGRGEVVVLRSRHRRKDGSVFPVELRGMPVLQGGRWLQIAISRDITEQRATERQLAESQRQLELIVRSLPGVVYRYELADPPRVLWMDERVNALTGYSAEAFLSGEQGLASLIAPEDFHRVEGALTALAEAGGGAIDLTYQLLHASGETRTVRDSATVTPAAEEGGVPTVEGIVFDVTGRVERERVLREAWLAEHERYEFVVAASGQVVYEWDPRSEIIHWSGGLTAVLGFTEQSHHYSRDEAIEQVHPSDRERVIAEWEFGSSPRSRVTLEYRRKHADGGYRWVWDHAIYERDLAGNVVRVIGVLQDITQRKQLEAQVSNAQRMETIGALAGGVAHDVNNYLTTILGNVDVAMIRLGNRDEWPELQDAHDAAAGCGELVRSLLTFAREQDPVRTRITFSQVVTDSLRMLRPLVGPGIEITPEVADAGPEFEADPLQVQQVLMNLVANARDAMGGHGQISVGAAVVSAVHPETGEPGTFAQLWVHDSGPGVPVEIRERVFEPYFTTKAFGGGTGLGLSIVHGIAHAHGGWAEVSPSDSGARISVFFPISEPKSGALLPPAP